MLDLKKTEVKQYSCAGILPVTQESPVPGVQESLFSSFPLPSFQIAQQQTGTGSMQANGHLFFPQ